MTFLDAAAVIAYLRAEPAGTEVRGLLRAGGCALAAPNAAEVVDKLIRRFEWPASRARDTIGALLAELTPVPADAAIAVRAGELCARHYRPRTAELSLADCLLLASAGSGDKIATSDAPLLRAGRAEGVEVVPLPDSSDNRPE